MSEHYRPDATYDRQPSAVACNVRTPACRRFGAVYWVVAESSPQVGLGRLVADNTVEASDHDLLHAMRGSQAPANRCNPLIITRSWSRGRRFEFARRLSKKCLFAGKTLEIKEASAHRPGLTYCNSPKKHYGSNGGGMAKSLRWSRAGRETGPIGGVAYWNRVTYFFRHRTGLSDEWEDVKETVELDWAPCTFGGERP